MKKILLSIFALAAFTACETIDEADRWTEFKPIEMKKNVLVEDFTGQNCINCPVAANLLHELSASSMGTHIVAVSIHGGAMSLNVKTLMGLATDLGDDYVRKWGNPALPAGMIDRTDGLGNVGRTCTFNSWTTAIVNRLSKELVVDLNVKTAFNAETRQLNVNVETSPAEGPNGYLDSGMRLTVWITESGIIGQQTMPDGSINRNYVHNHVLRECLSAPYGDNIIENAQPGENSLDLTYSYTIPATYGRNKWAVNPEQMAVVAFITASGGEVLQVIDAPVVKK